MQTLIHTSSASKAITSKSSIVTLSSNEINTVSGGVTGLSGTIVTLSLMYLLDQIGFINTFKLATGIVGLSSSIGYIASFSTYGDPKKALQSAEEKALLALLAADTYIFTSNLSWNITNDVRKFL